MDCIFCKIINGDIPSIKLYEDANVIAILDISQATMGHTLVIPKKHAANILEISDESYIEVMKVVKMLAKKITKAFNLKGVNILNNCGEIAGQTVHHFHVHIIPRYEENDITLAFNTHKYDLKEIADKINKA